MVDFGKKLKVAKIEKKVNPIDIYDNLDRKSETGPLRDSQSEILSEWYVNRNSDRDIIIKLNTGEGKTLIGLLILQSKLNAESKPCVFVCPNIYLVEQVCAEAEKFGIKYCVIGADKQLPNEFIDGDKILITHVQKVFNGKTIFGIGASSLEVGSILLDDSHACIDSIKSSFSISVKNDSSLYEDIFELFEDDIREQGEGSFHEIKNKIFDSFLPIPYWSWMNKSEDVIKIITQHINTNAVKFCWPILKDNINKCQAFISGTCLEISPIHIPIEKFASFSKAKHRILMSATTQDDSFFIKGLGFEEAAIMNSLTNPKQLWSGEKMIIIPSLINDSFDRSLMLSNLAKPKEKNFGIVSLVPSLNSSHSYYELGATIPKSKEITDAILKLKQGDYLNTCVLVNRYDGIDLPDNSCRILIIDSKPFLGSLEEKYEEDNRQNSDSVNIKIAQKIEQGLGRAVRGEKDYCIVFLLGADLINFMRSSRTRKYFSPQTRKHIEIGLDIVDSASDDIKEKGEEPIAVINSLIEQSLNRDEDWKRYYKQNMDSIEYAEKPSSIYNILKLERKAAKNLYDCNYEDACDNIQRILDKHCIDNYEKAWYLQILASYQCHMSLAKANKTQTIAFKLNNELLKPKEGITYKKLENINGNRNSRIRIWIQQHMTFTDLTLAVNDILDNIKFGPEADKFERSWKDLGLMLGFMSERPDKEQKKGPDNLWCISSNEYMMFECKTGVKESRKEIYKDEASQMNTHCGWFEEQYNADVPIKRILIIPAINLAYDANFTHDVEIMRKGKLKFLKKSIVNFYKEFKEYELKNLNDTYIQEMLQIHKLDNSSLKTLYSENYKKIVKKIRMK